MREETKPYEHLASLYDLGWSGHSDRYATFLGKLLDAQGVAKARILDLGCGTGTLAIRLAQTGHTVHGLDVSDSMIRVATEKAAHVRNVTFSVQNIEDFSVKGEFHLVTSTFGALNYLLNPASLERVFGRVDRVLAPEGRFVFDVNTTALYTAHHHGVVDRELGGTRVLQELGFDARTGIASTVFRFSGGQVERHLQRAYEVDEVSSLLNGSGLEVEAAFATLEGDPFVTGNLRLICIASRPEP